MAEELRPDVFISYSTKNLDVAEAIVKEFEANGISCWYAPRNIMPGEEWVSAITHGLEQCKTLVLIYTDESNESRQVMNEVAVAFNAGKTIVPFRLTESKMSSEFEYYLTRVHWLDGTNKSHSESIVELRKYVGILLSDVDHLDKTPNLTGTEKKRSRKKKVLSAAIIALIFAGAGALLLFIVTAIVLIFIAAGSGPRNLKKGIEYYNSEYHGTTDNDNARKYLEKASKKNEADAYYYLGMLDERDYDYESAKSNYEKGMSKGSDLAKLELGYLYEQGLGVSPDLNVAKQYYDEALNNGCLEANYFEGNFLLYGYYGEAVDNQGAMEYLIKSKDSEVKKIAADSYNLIATIATNVVSDESFDTSKVLNYYLKAEELYPYYQGKCNENIAGFYLIEGDDSKSEEAYKKAFDFYMASAEAGDDDSIINAGYYYQYGIGCEPDGEKAMDLYRKAADNGNPVAMTNVGTLYELGNGLVKKDPDKAYEWYKNAADIGNSDAMILIGDLYFNGKYGVKDDKPDYNMARYWYEEAVKNGSISAYFYLGLMYEMGYGADQDPDKAYEYFIFSSDYGISDATNEIGYMYDTGLLNDESNGELAYTWYLKAADAGNTMAMNNIGLIFEEKGDYESAKKWYLYAAVNNNVSSMRNLGWLYYNGYLSGNPDYENAFTWFKKAANTGDANAIAVIGNMYIEGLGVTKSYENAKECFDYLVESGNATYFDYYSLGYLYRNGFGVQADIDEAVKLYETASNLGYTRASEELGFMYYDGIDIDKDYFKAYFYLARAAENDDASAKVFKILGDMFFDGNGVAMDEDAAKKNYQTAVDMGIDDAEVYSKLGYICYNNAFYKSAADYFIKAADKEHNPTDMFNAGLAYYKNGLSTEDYRNALKWFGKAIDEGFEDRSRALDYIKKMKDAGYITEEEAAPWLG